VYDAEGNRVAQGTLSALSCNMATNGFALTSSYVLGPGWEEVSEFNGSGARQYTNIYSGGKLFATYLNAPSEVDFAVGVELHLWLRSLR
jgi:hypothetical protein